MILFEMKNYEHNEKISTDLDFWLHVSTCIILLAGLDGGTGLKRSPQEPSKISDWSKTIVYSTTCMELMTGAPLGEKDAQNEVRRIFIAPAFFTPPAPRSLEYLLGVLLV